MNTAQLREHYQSFDDDDLLELHQSGKLSDAAYPAIEAEMTARNISYPSRPAEWVAPESPPFFSSYRNGQRTLGRAFWLVWLIGHKLVLFGAYLGFSLLKKLIPKFEVVSLLVFGLYLVFAVVAVWRCGKNTSWPGWAWISRVVTVAYSGIALYGIALVIAK